MHQIKWLKQALNDRAAIVDHIAYKLYNYKAAIDFGDLVQAKVDLIASTETLFRQGKTPGTREFVLTPSYILVYRVRPRAQRTEILRILQARKIQ
jgi:toxin ParE1/3/4